MQSNDGPEIPDRGETSDIPGLPSGVVTKTLMNELTKINDHLTHALSSILSVSNDEGDVQDA